MISASLLAQGLAAAGAEVVASFPSEGRGAEIMRRVGVRVEIRRRPDTPAVLSGDGLIFSRLSAAAKWPSMIVDALSVLRRQKPNVVHVNDDTTLLPWALAARLFRIPAVWHVRIASRGRTDRLRCLLARGTIFISGFASQRCTFLEYQDIFYNPIDLERIPSVRRKQILRKELDIHAGAAFLFIGRDSPYKRLEWAISSLSDSLAQGANAHLYVLGNHKPDRVCEILSKQEPKVRQRIHFCGFVDNPEEYMTACDVLLAPAVGETLGRTYIEAAACSIPICAVSSGGAAELLEDEKTALLSNESDFEAFSRNCYRLASQHKLRAELVGHARKWATGFSIGKHADQVLGLYRRIGVEVDK